MVSPGETHDGMKPRQKEQRLPPILAGQNFLLGITGTTICHLFPSLSPVNAFLQALPLLHSEDEEGAEDKGQGTEPPPEEVRGRVGAG